MKFTYNEKENALLDAAMSLFIRYGYDKTTVEEIAKKAGISKGAVYLNFKSKEDLMKNLLFRETKNYNLRWFKLIDEDPKGGLLSGMYKNMLLAMTVSPLMTAAFKQDVALFGSYLKSKAGKPQSSSLGSNLIKKLQNAGAVRKDVDADAVEHITHMLAYALFSIQEIKPSKLIPPTENVIIAIADMMDRAFTPADGGDSEAGKKVLHQIADEGIAYYEKLINQKFENKL